MYLSELRVKIYSTTGSQRPAFNTPIKLFFSKLGRKLKTLFTGLRNRRLRVDILKAQGRQGEPLLIAILVTGGVGDWLLSARFLRDLANNTEPFQFDIYCRNPAIAEWIFANIPGYRASYVNFIYDHIQANYSLSLWVLQFIVIYKKSADWFAIRKRKKIAAALQNILNFEPVIELMIKNQPYLDGYLGKKTVFMNARRSNFLQLMSKIEYGGDELPLNFSDAILKKYGLQQGQYITIHNGFDHNASLRSKMATKCYKNFGAVVMGVKAKFPNLVVVQVGTKTSSPIPGVDFELINQTSLKEAAGLLKYSRLHVDIESGLVHLARSLGVKCCVVFGPTSVDYFGYPGNINIPPKECGDCWWVTQTWLDLCPRGFKEPLCMKSQDPQRIASKIIEELMDHFA